MTIKKNIFKSYDIRGIYPEDLNEEAAYQIGRAYAKKINVAEIVVGMDMRLSGDALKKELISGITDEGVNVIDIGLVPIDAVYFAVRIQKRPAGVMITASHNPKEYNGFKMPLLGIGWIRGEELYDDVKNLTSLENKAKGTIKKLDVIQDYLKHIMSFCDIEKIKPFTVVVDAGNGMAGKIIPLLEPRLPIKIIPLNFTLDGSFPAHPSNPLMPESQIQIKEAVVKNQADFGVIFDGDTDRLFFVDENGRFVQADKTLLVLAREFLNREPGAGIVYNAICSKIVSEKIIEWGGRPIISKVGFVNIMHAMAEQQGIMGGELSAHYSFRDNGYADSGFIAWLILLQLLSEDGRKLSEIVEEFNIYHKIDEINIAIDDPKRGEVIAKLKNTYKNGKQSDFDGLTISFENWWFNVRKSNTEPLLRVTIETQNEQMTEEKKQELLTIIEN